MDMSNTGGVEYPDEAGYPDGEGTLDEGTGAFREGDTVGGVEVEVEEPQGIEQLDEFDEADARDE